MSVCFLMSSLTNYGSSYFGVKISSLTPLNFGYRVPKVVGRNLGINKPIAGGNLFSTLFKSFCNEKSITIGYVVLYMHEENGIAE